MAETPDLDDLFANHPEAMTPLSTLWGHFPEERDLFFEREQMARELDFYQVLTPMAAQDAPFYENVDLWRRRASDWVDANRPALMKTLASAAAAGYDRHTFQFVLDSAKSHYFATGLTSTIAEKEAQSVLFRKALAAVLQSELSIYVRTSFHEGFYSSCLRLDFDWSCLVGAPSSASALLSPPPDRRQPPQPQFRPPSASTERSARSSAAAAARQRAASASPTQGRLRPPQSSEDGRRIVLGLSTLAQGDARFDHDDLDSERDRSATDSAPISENDESDV
eukprot:m51a1_g1719 hypothetical protein (280) ;mRNA; r:54994-58543